MKRNLNNEELFAPLSDEQPSGEDLRYTDTYEQIKEARRFDDSLDQGEWKTDLKTADWDKVISLCVQALSNKTKDLQIAAWLTEALIITEGFDGLAAGQNLITGFMERFWETVYPVIEDDDLEYRIAPFEFLNEKLSTTIKQVPLTDPGRTPGYSWLKWQESREVGYEGDTRDKHGDTDEKKKKKRDELIQEGRLLTGEDFDAAVAAGSPAFYTSLNRAIIGCLEAFKVMDALADEKFGKDAPRLTEFGKAIADCSQVVAKICKGRGILSPEDITEEAAGINESGPVTNDSATSTVQEESLPASALTLQEGPLPTQESGTDAVPKTMQQAVAFSPRASSGQPSPLSDMDPWENTLWEESLRLMKSTGVKKALEALLEASLNAPSTREGNRLKLLMARLCLKANRVDLARPILEQLNSLVEQLQLEQWESPVWIAEVLGGLYQCLMNGEATDDDRSRAFGIFQKLCTIDITRALGYKQQ